MANNLYKLLKINNNIKCPNCGSDDHIILKHSFSEIQIYQCLSCGKHFSIDNNALKSIPRRA